MKYTDKELLEQCTKREPNHCADKTPDENYCPRCNGSDLSDDPPIFLGLGFIYVEVVCVTCDYTWNDVFTLSSREPLLHQTPWETT